MWLWLTTASPQPNILQYFRVRVAAWSRVNSCFTLHSESLLQASMLTTTVPWLSTVASIGMAIGPPLVSFPFRTTHNCSSELSHCRFTPTKPFPSFVKSVLLPSPSPNLLTLRYHQGCDWLFAWRLRYIVNIPSFSNRHQLDLRCLLRLIANITRCFFWLGYVRLTCFTDSNIDAH